MESAPTNRGKARGQPGKREPGNVANLCRGRCSHRPADLAPPRTPAGGISGLRARRCAAVWPPKRACGRSKSRPLRTNFMFWANRDSLNHAGGRRAGCPPPAGPCGGTNTPGGYGIRPPTNEGKARGQPGTCEPGDVANLCRGRFHIGPVCGGAGFRGRDLRPKSRRCAAVGLRNAPAGAVNPAPTNRGKARDQPGKREPGDVTNLCRGRFHIGPVCGRAGQRRGLPLHHQPALRREARGRKEGDAVPGRWPRCGRGNR